MPRKIDKISSENALVLGLATARWGDLEDELPLMRSFRYAADR
jgi:hypothetical protein